MFSPYFVIYIYNLLHNFHLLSIQLTRTKNTNQIWIKIRYINDSLIEIELLIDLNDICSSVYYIR